MNHPRTAFSVRAELIEKLAAIFVSSATFSHMPVASAQDARSRTATSGSFKMAAFGDSITRTFNANTLGDHPGNSWATGHSNGGGIFNPGSVKSHAEFLQVLFRTHHSERI